MPPDQTDGDIQGIPPFYIGQSMTVDDLNRLLVALKQLDCRFAHLEQHCGLEASAP